MFLYFFKKIYNIIYQFLKENSNLIFLIINKIINFINNIIKIFTK